jgi:hypothetical protein
MRVLKVKTLVVLVGFAARAASSGMEHAGVALAGTQGNRALEAMQPLSEVVVAA